MYFNLMIRCTNHEILKSVSRETEVEKMDERTILLNLYFMTSVNHKMYKKKKVGSKFDIFHTPDCFE